jgi:WD40 repeat protein/Tfp pilus assembly protein PilF
MGGGRVRRPETRQRSNGRQILSALCTCVAGLLVSVAIVSTLSAWRLGEAEREKSEKLWQSYLDEVRARRSSREAGQRFGSLDKLGEAAAIVRSLNYSEAILSDNILKLRNEAIACMVLPDVRVRRTWPGNTHLMCNAAFDAGLERYATSDDLGNISVRQVADDSEILRIPNMQARPDFAWCHFSRDGRFLATKYRLGTSSRIVLWDLSSNKRIGEMPARVAAGGECLDFSPDSRRLAAGAPEGTIELYDCVSGKKLKSLGRDLLPEHIAFDPSGRKLAVCSSLVHILDVDTTDTLATLSQPAEKGGMPWSLAWSPDGRFLAVGSLDAKIRIWDITRRQPSMILEGHNESVIGLAFNHAGNLLLSGSDDGTSRLWDAIKARHLLTIPGRFCKLSSGGRQLALEQRAQLSICEMANCRELTTFPCAATTLDFSPTKGLLATAGPDGVRLWDLLSTREAADLCLDRCDTAAFHPKGRSLVTYGKASGLRLWPLRDDPAVVAWSGDHATTAGDHATTAGALQVGPPQVLGTTLTHIWGRACWSHDGRWLGVADYRNGTAFLLNPDRPGERLVLGSFPELATIAISPDGQWAAVGACDDREDHADGQVRIWHLPDRTPVRKLLGYSHAAFSPDGQWLVTGGNENYRFWRISTWDPGLLLPRSQDFRVGFAPLAFSPDGRMLALQCTTEHLQLVDPATGRETASLSAPGSRRITWVCFSPDGSRLGVTNAQEEVHLWDLRATRRQLAELGLDWSLPLYPPAKDVENNQPARVQVLQESKESWRSYWLVRGRAHQVFGQSSEAVIDFTEALRVLRLDAPPRQRSELLQLRALNFARNQAYEAALADLQKAVELAPDSATACHDLARLYVTGPQRLRDAHEALPLARRAVTLTPADPLYQNTLGVVYYRLAKYAQAMETLERSLPGSEGETAVFALFILAMCHARRGDGADAKSCYDRAVQWMQDRQGKLQPYTKQELNAFRAEAEELLRSKAPRLLNIVPQTSARATGMKLPTFARHTGPISSVALSADGQRLLTGSAHQTAVLWNAQTSSKLQTFTGHSDVVSSVALSRDGRRVLTGCFDFTAILWDATSGARLRTFTGHSREVVSVALSGDGQRVLTGSWDRTAILWDAASGARLQTFAGHSSCVNSVALSVDGQRVLTGSDDHTAILWDATTGIKLRTFAGGHTSAVNSVTLSVDGQRVLTGSDDHTAILWDAASGAKLCTFAGHSQEVVSVALSSDGRQILTASADQTAILWDVQSGAKRHTFAGHADEVRSVALSEDGRWVLTGSLDSAAILWDAKSGAQLRTFAGP